MISNSVWNNINLLNRVFELKRLEKTNRDIIDIVREEFDVSLTKNAVVGRLRRAGLCFPKVVSTKKKEIEKRIGRFAVHPRQSVGPSKIHLSKVFFDERGDEKPFCQTRENECKFLVETARGLLACGHTVHTGNYCHRHHLICTSRPEPQPRSYSPQRPGKPVFQSTRQRPFG